MDTLRIRSPIHVAFGLAVVLSIGEVPAHFVADLLQATPAPDDEIAEYVGKPGFQVGSLSTDPSGMGWR